jgi:hypothetical protein
VNKSAIDKLLILLLLLINGCASAATNLLPGLVYYKGDEALTNKLVFLVEHDYTAATNSQTAASIYEFDLEQEKLRKVIDCPTGSFIASRSGDAFCVMYWKGPWGIDKDRNAFVHSASLQTTRSVSLEVPPKAVVVEDGHVFFELSKLLDYDIARDETHLVELPDTGRWQYQDYNRIHVPLGQTNILHFYYNGRGKRLEAGTDYQDGFYAFDIGSRRAKWFAEILDDEDDASYTLKTADGHYIFFQGTGAPIEGTKLISSPWNDRQSEERDPKGQKSKLLHSFSILPRLTGGTYWLDQLSPDRRFALVRLGESTSRKSGMLPGWTKTYFLVDLSNGNTRVLLKDRTERETTSSISNVRWVGSPE